MYLTLSPIQIPSFLDFPVFPTSGACATFFGIVRNHDHGRKVSRLFYEAYETLAENELGRIAQGAKEKFSVAEVRLRHRHGFLEIGEVAVAIAVQSVHRGEAFAACRFVIDSIKDRVPIWKKEFYADGTVLWVRCSHG